MKNIQSRKIKREFFFNLGDIEKKMMNNKREIFSELEELELASQFLEISSEEELDSFVGNLIEKVSNLIKKFIKNDTKVSLRNFLKSTVKSKLPVMEKCEFLENVQEIKKGGKNWKRAGVLFGLELEGLTSEDQELEVARHFIKFAGDIIKKTFLFSTPLLPSQVVVKKAIRESAKKYAPGLLY